ncbi:hypothetical protein ABMA28_010823 [Loxostege sticticalis]|uniref:Uncharacterized protein n=1 Tax=Loxostege sticticalis TaxID=481309 RepID=A0ABD0S7D1_LOXSC
MAETINISDVCRFCLCVKPQKMHLLTDEILHAFSAYFSLQIIVVNSLPNQICEDCNNKTTLLCHFRKSVSENEKILHESLTKGCDELNKCLLSFQRETIKEEDENSYTIHDENDHANFEDDDGKENSKEIDSLSNFGDSFMKDDANELIDSKFREEPVYDTQNTVKDTNSVATFKFKCLTCFDSFESQNLLLAHYKTKHYEKPKEKNELKVVFDVETTPDGTIYKCTACSKVYGSKKSINRHVAEVHTDARPFLCKMCGRTYKTVSEIVRHGRAHDGKKLFCSHQCGYSTVYHGALKEHERRHNASEYKYKCDKCDKGFHVKTWYLQHQNIHTGVKPFVCDVCGAAFHMEKYLTTHRSLKHPQSSNLKRYVCVHCSLPCDSRNALTEHLKEHGLNTEKKFLCDLCGKIVSNAEQLKFHKRMHLGVKPYTCSTCNKSFAKKFNLQLHERTHSGEKEHECHCGRRYGQRSTLLRHMARHHSDSEKLKLSKCSKTFLSTQDQLATQQKLCT